MLAKAAALDEPDRSAGGLAGAAGHRVGRELWSRLSPKMTVTSPPALDPVRLLPRTCCASRYNSAPGRDAREPSDG